LRCGSPGNDNRRPGEPSFSSPCSAGGRVIFHALRRLLPRHPGRGRTEGRGASGIGRPPAERGEEEGATRQRARLTSLLVWHSRPRLCSPSKAEQAKGVLKHRSPEGSRMLGDRMACRPWRQPLDCGDSSPLFFRPFALCSLLPLRSSLCPLRGIFSFENEDDDEDEDDDDDEGAGACDAAAGGLECGAVRPIAKIPLRRNGV
jgi:hypothetical protein